MAVVGSVLKRIPTRRKSFILPYTIPLYKSRNMIYSVIFFKAIIVLLTLSTNVIAFDESETNPLPTSSGSEPSFPAATVKTSSRKRLRSGTMKEEKVDHIEKEYRMGGGWVKMKVQVPEEKEILRRKNQKYPKGYFRLEQKIARSAETFEKSGRFNNRQEAFQAAVEHHQSMKKKKLESRKQTERKSYLKPKGYNTRENWINRRIVGILATPNNGINNRPDAQKLAEVHYKNMTQKTVDGHRRSKKHKQ